MYVAPINAEHSYTKNPVEARRFPSRHAALADACGNESVRCLEKVIGLIPFTPDE
jgi:hypothetical protein